MTEKCYLCKTELLEHAATGAQQHVENACPLSRMELYPLAWRAVMQAIAAARRDALNDAGQVIAEHPIPLPFPNAQVLSKSEIVERDESILSRIRALASQPAAETGRAE